MGSRADDESVRLCSLSVVSQCLFYHQCRPVVQRLFPRFRTGPAAAAPLAEHITAFSVAGIEHSARVTRKGGRR
jgi:hypothetical protein